MHFNQVKQGFTLIELLVVVLIIGILAAVALPQYQKAVAKARLANIKGMLTAVKNAEEIYYLANGNYTADLSKLDIDMPTWSVLPADNTTYRDAYFAVDMLGSDTQQYVSAIYCPSLKESYNVLDRCAEKGDFIYTLWFNNSEENPGQITCAGLNSLGISICTTEGN